MRIRLSWLGTLAAVVAIWGSSEVLTGCGDSSQTVVPAGSGGSGASSTGGSSNGGNANGGTGGIPPAPTEQVQCQNQLYECGDLLDNDNDGLIDYQDPDCLGPCDNTEDSYYGGIPGQAGPACVVDCYFDSNSGSGNDECYWNHQCDPLSVDPNYYPEPDNGAACAYDPNATTPGTGASCDDLLNSQLPQCLDFCGPLTPNGCDCFGCCELPAGTGQFVWLGSEGLDPNNPTACTSAEINNPDFCHPCTPVTACLNGCDTCELCLGKTELPPECEPGEQECPDGLQKCGLAGQDPCPAEQYCISGCCIQIN